MKKSSHAGRLALSALLLVFCGALRAMAAEEVYAVDPVHSNVQFRIRHLMSRVTGSFNSYSGEIRLDRKNLSKGSVALEVDAASIDTRNEKRDQHLKSAEFFDVEKFPTLTFKSTKITVDAKDPNKLTVAGDLTMHGVTKPVTLDVQVEGFGKDPWGNERVGFVVDGGVNRKDFGILWNQALDAGGTLLGDEVELLIAIEGVKKVEAPPEEKKAGEAKKG